MAIKDVLAVVDTGDRDEQFSDGDQIHVSVGEQIEEFIQPSENRGEA